MLSKKFCCKSALLLDDLRRYSPVWVVASLGMLLFPLTIWMQYQNMVRDAIELSIVTGNGNTGYTPLADFAMDVNRFMLEMLGDVGAVALLIYAIVPAMALLHYLYQSRSALGTHALPITRTELFVTHYLAGICMILLPLLVFCVVTIPVLLAVGAFWWKTIAVFCAVIFCMYLFFFSFAMFCGMFTGQLFGVPLYYAIFNGIAPLTFLLFVSMAQQFWYGFSSVGIQGQLVKAFTPVWQFCDVLYLESIVNDGVFALQGVHVVAIYALVGVVFAALAGLVFRRRQLECAGEIVAVGILRPLFAACCGFYGGFCMQMGYSYVFEGDETGWLFFFLVLGTVLGGFIGRMLLEKTLAVFNLRNVGQIAVVLVLSCICFSTVRFDLLGYEDYVPELEDIESVSIETALYADAMRISFYDTLTVTATTDPDIALLRNAHLALLAEYAETGEMYPTTDPVVVVEIESVEPLSATTEAAVGEYTYQYGNAYLEIAYTLTSGQVVRRAYYVMVSESEIATAGTPAAYLEEYVNGVDLVALLQSQRNHVGVDVIMYQDLFQDDGDGYTSMYFEDNTVQSKAVLDVVAAAIEAQDLQASLLRKYYIAEQSGYLSLNFYDKEIIAGNTVYNYHGYLSWSIYPGTEMETYAIDLLTGTMAE